MSAKTGLLYSTVDGHTLKICNILKDVFQENDQDVELFSIEEFDGDVTRYDRFIIGSSVRYGVHNKKVIEFINTHKKELDAVRTAFFSVNLVARKPEKRTPDTNPYVIKFFKSVDWTPTVVEVFAGKLNYKIYSFFDRIMIQLIMWMTKGPTSTDTEIDYTDWNRVKEFGLRLCKL